MTIEINEGVAKWMWERFDKLDECMKKNKEICEMLDNGDFSLSCEDRKKFLNEYEKAQMDFANVMHCILKEKRRKQIA